MTLQFSFVSKIICKIIYNVNITLTINANWFKVQIE